MNVFLPFVFLNYFDLVSRFHLYKAETFRVFPFTRIDDFNERGLQPIHLAVEIGNLSATMALIETFGASPTAETRAQTCDIPKGSTPLIISIIKNNLEIFQYLFSKLSVSDLEHCDEQLKTPLHFAAETGNSVMVETILSVTKKIGHLRLTRISPLHLALAGGHVEVTKLFAERNLGFGPVMGPHKNPSSIPLSIGLLESTIFYLARQKHPLPIWIELWKICTRNVENVFAPNKLTKKTVLDVALEAENDEIAAILIILGADLKTHLDSNISMRHRDFFIELNDFFSDIGRIDPDLRNHLRGNDTIWHICARHNALFFVKALLIHFPMDNFSVQANDNRVSAVEIAVEKKFEELALELLKLHRQIIEFPVLETLTCSAALGSQYRVLEALIDNFPLDFGTLMTVSEAVKPLHILVTTTLSQPKEGLKEIIFLLLKKYPFVLGVHDRLGRTPLHLALECNFVDFFFWLREAKDREGIALDFDVQHLNGYSFLKSLHDENHQNIINILK